YGTEPLFFGTSHAWFDGKLDGLLDEVTLFGRALSPAEVQALASGGPGPAGPVTVADAALSDTTASTSISATEGAATGTQVVARFRDADPGATAADFSATIYWGDGSSDTATAARGGIIQNADGSFSVLGSHSYAEEGTYHVYAVVTDTDGGS